MTTNKLTGLVLACAMSVLPEIAAGEGGGYGHRPPPPPPPPMSPMKGPPPGIPDHLLEQLELTEEQTAVLEALETAHEEATADTREQLGSLHDEMRLLWSEDNLDSEELLETSRKISETRAKLDEERVRFRIGFVELLTSDQRRVLEKAEKHRRRSRRGPRPR